MNRWVKTSAVAAAVLFPSGVAFTILGVQISSQPRFCGGCHYMEPYYQSWLTSTHKDVACVECHIPPGISSEVRKKYEALAMVARYFTGTYSTNPWAEVDDQSCLRSGCHTKRVLLSKEVYLGTLFDHQPHLAEMRRGKRLRCTSCHSQIVQGSHISVTASTCFLCHFKNTPLNQGTGRCTLCHQVPEEMITTAGLSFDHGDVKRFDMNCTWCHEGVVRGEGEVVSERCYTCHNDPKRLELYENMELLHQTHVTDHKIECLNCHIEIVHKIPAREEVLSAECRSCHDAAAGHSAVRDLYRGIAAKGVHPRPAPMYLAGVRCEACHNPLLADFGRASDVSCMSCHGPAYLTIYRTWQAGLAKRLGGVKVELEEARRKIEATGNADALTSLREAGENLALLERGKGIHNPGYAVDLLESTHRDIAAALEASGGKTTPALPWLQAPYETECLRCHFGIEYISRPAFDREFPHGTHVISARLRCLVCHGAMDKHGSLQIGAEDCQRCHDRIAAPMAVAADECLKCHPAEIGAVSEKVNFPHGQHIAYGLDCAICHAGVAEKRHLQFAKSRDALPPLGHELCGTCHSADTPSAEGVPPEGADCAKCHVEF